MRDILITDDEETLCVRNHTVQKDAKDAVDRTYGQRRNESKWELKEY